MKSVILPEIDYSNGLQCLDSDFNWRHARKALVRILDEDGAEIETFLVDREAGMDGKAFMKHAMVQAGVAKTALAEDAA